tara:strand:- start:59 stop:523 length:465 start_codon:yes stop_codon:yes gene_type:complete
MDNMELGTRFLFEMRLYAKRVDELGNLPKGKTQFVLGKSGIVKGPHLNGIVLEGATAVVSTRPDGVQQSDVRLVIKTDDDALILMSYFGRRHGSEAVMSQISNGENPQAHEYYFRTVPTFETAVSKYSWLNKIVAVGIGRRLPDGLNYRVFEVL